MKQTVIMKTVFAALVILAAQVAQAELQCGLVQTSGEIFDINIIENVDHPALNTIVVKDKYESKQYWLGKMTIEHLGPDILGGFMTKKTIDLADKGVLTLVYSKSEIKSKKPCGRGSCIGDIFELETINAQLKNKTQTQDFECHEIPNL